MLSAAQAKRLRTLVTQLVLAEREDAYKGSYPPDEAKDIQEHTKQKRERLTEFIATITEK